jgi:hypothetical protein
MNSNERAFIPTPCPECGGRRKLVRCDPHMNLQASAFRIVPLQALACLNCGYTTLYADSEQLGKKLT